MGVVSAALSFQRPPVRLSSPGPTSAALEQSPRQDLLLHLLRWSRRPCRKIDAGGTGQAHGGCGGRVL